MPKAPKEGQRKAKKRLEQSKPQPLEEQVWKHGSVHYKIAELLADGSILAQTRNGPVGRWSSKTRTLTPSELNHLEFVKGPKKSSYKLPDFQSATKAEITSAEHRRAFNLKKTRRFVVTYAQNATPVNPKFLKSLLVYCEFNQAELIVIPGRYRNPTSIWSKKDKGNSWWDKRLVPYMITKRFPLLSNLTIYGDISIQPTAIRPLTGMEVFTGKSSAIFGHPKIQLSTVATDSRKSKLMVTTGSITVQNYTDSKAGKKGDAHHVFGATVVELGKQGDFHLRQINANKEDGSFIDLNWEYTEHRRYKAPPAEALILGDVHAENVEEQALQASFDMATELECQKVLFHDLLDFRVRNHHSIDNFKHRYARATVNYMNDSVETELAKTIAILEATPEHAEPIVIQSNHDEAFDRWLENANPKNDPVNSLLFHKMWVEKIEKFNETGKWKTAFDLYYRLKGYSRAKFLNREEPLNIKGISCGYHGDKGINGSRGNPRAYAKLGVKTVIGHVHTPSITDGCYTVGVIGKLNQGYNSLPSSWAHANCVIYANGKRSLIFIQPESGKWRI